MSIEIATTYSSGLATRQDSETRSGSIGLRVDYLVSSLALCSADFFSIRFLANWPVHGVEIGAESVRWEVATTRKPGRPLGFFVCVWPDKRGIGNGGVREWGRKQLTIPDSRYKCCDSES